MRIDWKAMYSAKNGQCLYVWCCVILEIQEILVPSVSIPKLNSERAIDINVGKPVCLENSNLYMLHFSAMFMQVGTIFFWVIPPMTITFLVVRYLVCTRWCSYEKLTSLFAMEEKAQGFAELS